ncbi:MAG: hypothetical protein FJ145_21605 [Deltaproteobacteria bacterium]|nr:hypothetical protein [Deltaproteobacteria bacterium]
MRLIVLGLFAIPFLVVGAVFLAIDSTPLVDREADVTPANIERAKRILEANNPRHIKAGTIKTVTVSQADFDLAANYLAHRFAGGSARVALREGAAELTVSLRLPIARVRRFINVEATLRDGAGLPPFESLKFGAITVPGGLADWLLRKALIQTFGAEELEIVAASVKNLRAGSGRVSLTYEWRKDLLDTVRNTLMPTEEQERLRIYHERLAALTHEINSHSASLIEFLVPLFKLAEQRSIDGDAVAENRAAVLALTLYTYGRPAGSFFPSAKSWRAPRRLAVTLSKREDFPKHFIVSAALAAFAGTPLADAVGLYKEIADTRGGSGFSFNDIAADRAGTVFGEHATKNVTSATKLQRRVAAGLSELYIIPVTEDLPEYMSAVQFKHTYGGVGSPAYNEVMADIERRVAKLTLYR